MPFQPFEDPELGLITIKPHATARSFIFRGTKEGIQITCPQRVSREQILDAFRKQRERLPRLLKKKNAPLQLVKDAEIQMTGFEVHIRESGYGNMYQARFAKGVLELVCPCQTDYTRPEVQAFFEKNILKVIRYQAEVHLPSRLDELARSLGINYRSCGISYGKSRLGRCDNLGNILLSYRLMLLPGHLSDYVILHELAHLTEMNHGPRFHQLLNHYCEGLHRYREKELKQFQYPF